MSVDALVYSAQSVDEYDDIAAAITADGETWVHVQNPEPADLSVLQDTCGIHPLAIEDIRAEGSRPKTEEYENHTFVLLKTADLRRGDVAFEKEILVQPIGFFIGDGWLVTITDSDLEIIATEATRWTGRQTQFSERGIDFVAYRIMDDVVDQYFDVLDDIETDIETIEESILEQPSAGVIEQLNGVRRDLLAFRKLVWPTREAIGALARSDVAGIHPQNDKYFRDIYDHLVQVVDLIETYRDLTSGSRDIYLNTVSQSTNEVMKTLTIVATIFIPLTFVAGVYGMNFADTPYAMPELSWTFGYPATMLGMAAIAVIMLAHFREQDWI